jgi:hypothetical protein
MLWAQLRAKDTRTETQRSFKKSNTRKTPALPITSKLLEAREARIDTFSPSRVVKQSSFKPLS